jgi:uncharacterized coiled-coil protein SlyX
MKRSALRLGFLLNALALAVAWLAPSQLAHAQCPQICDAADNTAVGQNALLNNTGANNTAIGFNALLSNTTGFLNTAIGVQALQFNTTGTNNTAAGFEALFSNTTGHDNTAEGYNVLGSNTTGAFNTATGEDALFSNTIGSDNTANGVEALFSNTIGSDNTATGVAALERNTTGSNNTANGFEALTINTTGSNNTAHGFLALFNNTTGTSNTADGDNALSSNTSGSFNIAVGHNAGFSLTTGINNIDIGNQGVAGESKTIRIGRQGLQTATYIAAISGATVPTGIAVIVDSTGHLGTTTSSARFKDAIKPMDDASEAILALKPVTFRYKHDLDPKGILQFGLVAEDVEKINPDLVARDEQGKPYTVRYEAVNAMLLNEFLKEHRKNEEQRATIAQQQKDIEALKADLKEQRSLISKVSTQLELIKVTPQAVSNMYSTPSTLKQ